MNSTFGEADVIIHLICTDHCNSHHVLLELRGSFYSGTVLSNRVDKETAAYRKTKQGCLENMEAMAFGNIDKLDMIMLDYPGPNDESIRGQWRAFEEMKSNDLTVDDLAVSNFSPTQLDAILAVPGATKPTVNQLPFSVAYHPQNILEYNTKRDIFVQSWSPLSKVLRRYGPQLESIGKGYGKSPAQVGLRFIVQSGAGFCTQSSSKEHFVEDLNVFDFKLTDGEMTQLYQLAA
jgi:2,5-diketo-D-gluconate reductase A